VDVIKKVEVGKQDHGGVKVFENAYLSVSLFDDQPLEDSEPKLEPSRSMQDVKSSMSQRAVKSAERLAPSVVGGGWQWL
jgi:hypothetical protein